MLLQCSIEVLSLRQQPTLLRHLLRQDRKKNEGLSEITEITASGGMALITGLGSGGQCLERKYSIESPRHWSASTDKATLG